MLVRDIEKALLHSEQNGYGFGPMSLSKGALVHLTRRMESGEGGGALNVLELGGGQSTLFWQSLLALELLSVQVTTLEHQPTWASELQAKVEGQPIRVVRQSLKQISDGDWERLFADPDRAAGLWATIGEEVPEAQYGHYTIRNTFYGDILPQFAAPNSIDAMIVDGPHGNGRSLAYPLFAAALKPGALVLIDDFDHYPYLADLGRIFRYEELYREMIGNKHWVLARISERKKSSGI